MPAVIIATGLLLGAFAASIWLTITRRIDTQSLFTALARAVRAMLSDEGNFLLEYGALLVSVGRFVFWNVLAIAAAVSPLLVVDWIFWRQFQEHLVLLIVVYSATSMVGIFWLQARAKRASEEADRGGLSVSDSQYFFLQIAESAPWLIRRVAALETRLLRRRLNSIPIDRPVFIAGLARSGTTMLLEMLAQARGVATHEYRDFPFLRTPFFWNQFVRAFGAKGDSVQRPHRDGIRITPESPEAFEEPIWQFYFPAVHRLVADHVLKDEDRNQVFDEVFVEHLKKMLLIRKGERYLSKGNYNLTRIEYLRSLFPEARFVIPIRHPLTHVASLVRQHELFCEYAQQDPRVPHYLTAAGHFEFGPQRVPISVRGSAEQTLAAWEAGNEHLGYAIQWAAVYEYVLEAVKRSPQLAERVLFVRYEDICDNPWRELKKVLRHVSLEEEGAALRDHCGHIKSASRPRTDLDETFAAVWAKTEEVAVAFGYHLGGHEENWSLESMGNDIRS